jgi:hypothetical protein
MTLINLFLSQLARSNTNKSAEGGQEPKKVSVSYRKRVPTERKSEDGAESAWGSEKSFLSEPSHIERQREIDYRSDGGQLQGDKMTMLLDGATDTLGARLSSLCPVKRQRSLNSLCEPGNATKKGCGHEDAEHVSGASPQA